MASLTRQLRRACHGSTWSWNFCMRGWGWHGMAMLHRGRTRAWYTPKIWILSARLSSAVFALYDVAPLRMLCPVLSRWPKNGTKQKHVTGLESSFFRSVTVPQPSIHRMSRPGSAQQKPCRLLRSGMHLPTTVSAAEIRSSLSPHRNENYKASFSTELTWAW